MHFLYRFLILTIALMLCAGIALGQKQNKVANGSNISITESKICEDIKDRMPVDGRDVFPKGVLRLYCFTRVVGALKKTTLTHNWYQNGKLKASVKLSVSSADYRTWSSKTMTAESSGEWLVEILSEEGKPLQNLLFYIQ